MFALKRFQSCRFKFIPKIIATQIHSHSVLLKYTNEDHLKLNIKGNDLKFPFVWLRDNCQCDQCFHRTAKSRILDWTKFDINIKPANVAQGENSLQVTWSDGHKSSYEFDWLKFRSFTPENQKTYKDTIFRPKRITWHGDDFENIFSKHYYNDIVKSDEALYNWLHQLSIYGVALIQNTPASETAVDKIVDKIGFTKRTHYGIKFIVQHVANTSNVAYLSSNLQMHTDLPYYEYCPGVNLLHCLVQTASRGGENLLVDCHYVANYMKENHPDEYKILTDTEVEWNDIGVEDGNEFYKLNRSPVISLDKNGEITKINFSVAQRSSNLPAPYESVIPWYKSYALFHNLGRKFAAKYKTQDGDILVFDNRRLLHSRSAYEDNSNNVRKLIGAYVDWDEIYSRLRCLTVKLKYVDGIFQSNHRG